MPSSPYAKYYTTQSVPVIKEPPPERPRTQANKRRSTVLANRHGAADWIIGPEDPPNYKFAVKGSLTIRESWPAPGGFIVGGLLESGPHTGCFLLVKVWRIHIKDIERAANGLVDPTTFIGMAMYVEGRAWSPRPRHVGWLMAHDHYRLL